jgi:energy-coupling factor transporter ATP-binding protein EcfA2
MIRIGQVTSSAPNLIIVQIQDLVVFEANKQNFQVGSYLKISEGNTDFVVAMIRNIKGDYKVVDGEQEWTFSLECQPLGTLVGNTQFKRGAATLPVPTEPVFIVDEDTLSSIFNVSAEYDFVLGKPLLNNKFDFKVNGDRFFGKHIAIVGSTGSGKSCTVSNIIQGVVGISDKKNINIDSKNNSHIVIFDVHSEYRSAFTLEDEQDFTLNPLGIDNFKLPYWLMNSEELESMFIESNEANSHNQVSQFKQAVILNKERHNPSLHQITYDSPVFFSITEVYYYIENMNREMIGRCETDNNSPKLLDGTQINDRKEYYFEKIHDFVPQSTAKADKATAGPFNGEFNRFVSRLETKLSDKRLKFLFNPQKEDGTPLKTDDFEIIMKQFLGYLTKANITIVDLGGIPFEVLSVSVSLISRLIFDFCYHYSKLQHSQELLNDVPVMLVCEEAHNYVPQADNAAFKSSKKSIERIAKEGRKYGLSLMIVSQRPSEISESIFSQCSNFISLRLTNNNDQNYVKFLLPDNSTSLVDILPNLASGEWIVVGDSVILPMAVKFPKPSPEPKSQSVKSFNELQTPWKDVVFSEVIKKWRKEE